MLVSRMGSLCTGPGTANTMRSIGLPALRPWDLKVDPEGAAAVKAFEFDAMAKRVFSSTGSPPPSSRSPYPFMRTVWPSFTINTANDSGGGVWAAGVVCIDFFEFGCPAAPVHHRSPAQGDLTRLYFPADSRQLAALIQRVFHDPGLRFVFSNRSATRNRVMLPASSESRLATVLMISLRGSRTR